MLVPLPSTIGTRVPDYLAWFDPADAPEDPLDGREAHELRPGLWLVATSSTRSELYHDLTWSLPTGSAVLVAPLADWPKFRGMAPGSLSWTRGRAAAREDRPPGGESPRS